MRISKIRKVKTPTRGTSKSAGIDFYIPDEFPTGTFINTGDNKKTVPAQDDYVVLSPGWSTKIPSGIKVQVPSGYALIAHNKSGIAANHNLIVGASVIDEDYQGEIHLHLINVGKSDVTLEAGQKIVQFLLLQQFYDEIEVVDEKELFLKETERRDGGFGSTGLD